MAQKVILDVDTGTDDAVALMFAALHPELELVGATTVNGNVPVEMCTENSLRVFDHIGVSVPVYEGVRKPIERDDFPIPRGDIQSSNAVHGGYLDIPASTSTKQATDAIDFLIETYLAATDEIILVPVGPLSNVATALTREPRLKDRIPELVIMGGANRYGNVTPRAEFNVWADPEAARDRGQQRRPEDHDGPARRDPRRPRLAGGLRGTAGPRDACRRRRRDLHRATHPRLRRHAADEASGRRTGPRRAGGRRDRRPLGHHHPPPARRCRDPG